MRVLQQKLEPLEPETTMEVMLKTPTKSIILYSNYGCLINSWENFVIFNLQTESEGGAASASAKKNFIDQYFGVEFETRYPSVFVNQIFVHFNTWEIYIYKYKFHFKRLHCSFIVVGNEIKSRGETLMSRASS